MAFAAPVVPYLMMAGSAISIYGSYQQAQAQQAAGQYQQFSYALSAEAAANKGMEDMMQTAAAVKFKEYEAKEIRRNAQDQATQIKEAARLMRTKQTAVAASQGIVVNEGSAAMVKDQTTQLAERDAIVAIYSGSQQALIKELEAEYTSMAGSAAFQQSFMQGVSQRMTGGYLAQAANVQANATLLNGISTGLSGMGNAAMMMAKTN